MSTRLIKWVICIWMIACNQYNIYAQAQTDTGALIKEFRKVMSFATQPYLHFKMITKMDAMPVLEPQDTASLPGEFYKNELDVYFSNGTEEIYLQDSFMMQVNHQRKSIWISRVDIDSKERLNVLPVTNKQVQQLFRKKYSIKKTTTDGNSSRLDFISIQNADSITTVSTNIALEYNEKQYLPTLVETSMHMQQPLSDELLAALKADNIDDTKLIQEISGTRYLVRMQKSSVYFSSISNKKEEAVLMPSWKNMVSYSETGNDFVPKGIYAGYEITKTF